MRPAILLPVSPAWRMGEASGGQEIRGVVRSGKKSTILSTVDRLAILMQYGNLPTYISRVRARVQ